MKERKERTGKIRRERRRDRKEERRRDERSKESYKTLKKIFKNLPFIGVVGKGLIYIVILMYCWV